MKSSFFVLLILVLLASCSLLKRATKDGDLRGGTTSIRLRQQPNATSVEAGSWLDKKVLFRVAARLTSKIQSGGKPEVRICFHFAEDRVGELDSVMYFDLDGEKIQLLSAGHKCSHSVSCEFVVPENFWISIVYSQKIGYRVYLGYKGIDVELTAAETGRVKKFFSQVIRQRGANLPAIPEGQKKW